MDQQRLGKGMMTIAWVSALVLLTWAFQHLSGERHNPNRQIGGTGKEVVLKRNRQGHYVASGMINGRPVVFFLDTGATSVSVPGSVARDLNLERGVPMQVSTANGAATAYATRLNSVNLGGIEQYNVRATINPSMEGKEVLLGMSFLKHLEFTQRGDEMTLRP